MLRMAAEPTVGRSTLVVRNRTPSRRGSLAALSDSFEHWSDLACITALERDAKYKIKHGRLQV